MYTNMALCVYLTKCWLVLPSKKMELFILECAILWSLNVSMAQSVKARLRAKLTWEQKLRAESDKLISHIKLCELILHSPMLRVGYVMVCWVKLILIWCGVVHKVSIAERATLSGCIYYDVIMCCAYLGITCNHFLCAYTTTGTNIVFLCLPQHSTKMWLMMFKGCDRMRA